MTDTTPEVLVRQTVERLIENGSHYRTEVLDELYHDDLKIVKIDEAGGVTVLDREQNMTFFRQKEKERAAPLSTATTLNYVDADERRGHVIVTRHMQLGARPEKSVFSIHLVREDGRWQILRETAFVQPDHT